MEVRAPRRFCARRAAQRWLAVRCHDVALLVSGLSKIPQPIAALGWVKANRPAAVLYSDSLRRHASFYWREGETNSEPKTDADCDQFRCIVESGRAVLSSNANLCRLSRTKVASFNRDARIHDKHHFEFIFEFGKSDRTRVETPSVND